MFEIYSMAELLLLMLRYTIEGAIMGLPAKRDKFYRNMTMKIILLFLYK